MSMPNFDPPAEPVEQTPAEPVAPAEPAEPAPLHPAWEKSIEHIPEMLRGPIVEQIRKSDSEAQRAIEAARGTVEPEWQEFLTSARAAKVTPEVLVASYNAGQAIRKDPIKFLDDFTKEIDQAVADGRLTRPQAAAAQQQAASAAQAQVDDPDALLTPEMKELQELREQLAGVQGTLTAQQQREQQQIEAQQQREGEEYGRQFFAEVDTRLAAVFGNELFNTMQVDTKIAVARAADAALDRDRTGKLTMEQAITGAVNELARISGRAAAPTQQQPIPPIGGGTPNRPAGQPQTFSKDRAGEAAREAAMLAEGARFAAES